MYEDNNHMTPESGAGPDGEQQPSNLQGGAQDGGMRQDNLFYGSTGGNAGNGMDPRERSNPNGGYYTSGYPNGGNAGISGNEYLKGGNAGMPGSEHLSGGSGIPGNEYSNGGYGTPGSEYSSGGYGTPGGGYPNGGYGSSPNGNYGLPYQNPYVSYNANGESKKSGDNQAFGIVSLVLGIISLLLFCTCFGVLFAIVSLVFGIIQLVKGEKKGLAIGGVATSGTALLLALVLYILIFMSSYGYEGWYEDWYREYDYLEYETNSEIWEEIFDGTYQGGKEL